MTESAMREVADQTFECLYDRASGRTFTGVHFKKCAFESCVFSQTDKPELRSRAVGLRFTNCSVQGSSLDPGILDDVVVDGLKTRGLLQVWGVAMRHVVLTGRIGDVMFSPVVSINLMGTPAHIGIQKAFTEANREFYRTVDWAIDISTGEFTDLELQGVPARLVRRDPATQVIVTREKALEGKWRELDLTDTHWSTSIDFLLERGDEDVVLVAGKRNRKFRQLVAGLEKLRAAGVAE